MSSLPKHPNVVKLFEVIDDPQNDKVCLVMEYISGGPVLKKEDIGNPKVNLKVNKVYTNIKRQTKSLNRAERYFEMSFYFYLEELTFVKKEKFSTGSYLLSKLCI